MKIQRVIQKKFRKSKTKYMSRLIKYFIQIKVLNYNVFIANIYLIILK